MSHKLPHYAKPVTFYIILYGAGNINNSFFRLRLGDAFVKGLFRDIH